MLDDDDDGDWLRKLFLVVRRCEWTFYFNAEGAVPKEDINRNKRLSLIDLIMARRGGGGG